MRLSLHWLTSLMINSWRWQGWVTLGPWVNLSGGLLSYEWWHNDKAECHHFVARGGEIGREMADSFRPAYQRYPVLTTPCLKQREFGVHRSLFSAHCRLSLIDDLEVLLCVCWCVRVPAGRCSCWRVLDGSWKCYSYIYSRGKYVMRLQWIKYSAQILMYLYATSIFFYSTTSQREMLHFQPHQLSQELTTLTTSCFTKISTHKIYEELLKYGDLL